MSKLTGENSLRRGLDYGNKSLRVVVRTKHLSLFSLRYRLLSRQRPLSGVRRAIVPAPEENEMAQVRALLRTAPSRIGRKLAQIVAIAAASLPAAGA
jgi:hypothetical protein